jgi:rhodanese-related sulfurtransferase
MGSLSLVAPLNSQPDNVTPRSAWECLEADPKAVLIDVRTRSEWLFVGTPDLSSLARQPLFIEWLTFPDNRLNPDFVGQLSQELAARGADKNTDLYFICRSGARSLHAATAMAAVGFTRCHNVEAGFEGPLDPTKQRGRHSGWKASSLPWVQS